MTNRELMNALEAYSSESELTLEISSGWREALAAVVHDASGDQGLRIILTSRPDRGVAAAVRAGNYSASGDAGEEAE